MVIFLNMDGTGEVVTPERVFQGSDNVTEITAIAPYSADTRLEIGFILPDGLYWTNSDGVRYVPMEFAAKDNDKNVTAWSFTLPFSVTEQVGKVKIAINATTTTGNTTSYLCEFTVEESVLPNKPPAPDPSVYEYLSLYLSRLDGRTANVPNLVWKIQKTGGNSFTYTDNKGIVSEITLGEIDYNPTYVGAASVVEIPVDAWKEVFTGYTVTVTAAQHGQMQDGATPNDLWLSFDETENGVISGVYQGYTVNDEGDITLNVTTPVALTVRVWNGKGLKDTIARDAITAETERAEAAETQLQAQIDDIVQSGVDKTAREQIAAETERAEAAESELNAQIEIIESYISTGTSESNQLVNKDFVNSSINAMAAFYVEYNAQGDAFPTRADLLNATVFYNAGQPRIPTQNDYAYVLSDESRPKDSLGNYPTTRYSYQGGTYPNGRWGFQYVVNNTSLTQAQVNAINSGITKELVDTISKGNVLSVNGQTGAVTITPTNINAVNKSGDEMTGTLKMTGQNYPQIIFKSVSPTANGMQVFFEQQANGQMLIVGRTGETAESNVYIVRVPENDGTIALLDASGNFTAPIVQANNAFLLGENTGSNSQGRIENNPTSKSLDILAPNPTTGAYEVSAKNRGGAYAVFRAKEVYEGTERVYSPNKPNTQLIYDSNTSITVASGGNAIVYNGVIRGVALQNGDLVQIVGYLGDTSATANVVNIIFPIDVNSIGSVQYTNLAYKTTGGYTGRFMVYLETSNRNLVVRFAREFLPDNTVNETPMTVTRVRIRRFAQ